MYGTYLTSTSAVNKQQLAQRFGGIERLYGKGSLELFDSLHICIVGMGGVGSWAVEALARTGIGELTLIDYDEICTTNINRQIHALDTTVGRKKALELQTRVNQINPRCRCHVIDDYVNKNNIRDYLSPDNDYHYVIDAIDSISLKAAIIYQCKRNRIPVITTGGAGGLTDPTMIQVKDLSRTYNDPLAAKVRAKLREEFNFSRNTKRYFGIECVFSSQQQLYPKTDGSVGHQKPGIHGVNLDCSLGYGSASFVTANFGFVAVSRLIHKLMRKHARQAVKNCL